MAEQVHRYTPCAKAITFSAGGSITAGNLVELSAAGTVTATTAASAKVIGTAATDASTGGKVAVLRGGVQRCVSGGAIALGAHVVSAASGAVVTIGAGTFDQDLGIALNLTTAGGQAVDVLFTR
jgi:hypothetical protein